MRPNLLLLPVLLLFTALLASCTASHSLQRSANVPSPPKLTREGALYVSVPADGAYGAQVYEGSGAMTADAIVAAGTTRFERVERGTAPESPEEALQRAAQAGCRYCLHPTILLWEDRATEWSGRQDNVQLKLVLTEVEGQKLLDEVVLHGKSKWASFGGDHPQDLLPGAIEEYMAGVF